MIEEEEWDSAKKAAAAWEFLGWAGKWGCITAFLLPFILVGLMIVIFLVEPEVKEEVLWHNKEFYLQYESYFSGSDGHHLLFQINDEKKEILPHVYGYSKKKGFIYLAAAEGYGVIDRKKGTVKIVLFSSEIPQIDTEKIQYSNDSNLFSSDEKEKITSLSHTLRAYLVNIPWRDSDTKTVGDGRFQYDYGRYSPEHIERNLEVYGLYGNFDEQNTLLEDVTGLRIEEKSQMMYVTSPHGCAVIDGLSGTCRVLLTNRDAAPPDYQKDIQVLDSFDQFTPEEQAILLEVEKEGFK